MEEYFKFFKFPFSFQDPASTYAIHIFTVHHNIIWYLIIVLCLVYWCLTIIIKDFIWHFPSYNYVFFYKMFIVLIQDLRKASFWLVDEHGVLLEEKDDEDWIPSRWHVDNIKLYKPINIKDEDSIVIKKRLLVFKPKQYRLLRIIRWITNWIKIIHYQFIIMYYYFSSFVIVYKLNDADIGNGDVELTANEWDIIRVDLYIDFFYNRS